MFPLLLLQRLDGSNEVVIKRGQIVQPFPAVAEGFEDDLVTFTANADFVSGEAVFFGRRTVWPCSLSMSWAVVMPDSLGLW